MEAQVSGTLRYGCGPCGDYQSEEDVEIRKGPWTVEEDSILTEYVTVHGEGRWNTAARCAGLKRTGKSCRLRWLNYLRPDVRRGNISLKEQLLILQLHFLLGNRWSKIAQHLPGRTDNEIKNYWRTRVQKLAKHLKCDINSKQFRDAMHYFWLPRLIERINAASSASTTTTINISSSSSGSSSGQPTTTINSNYHALAVPNIPQPASGWGDPYFNPNPSLDSFDAQVSSNTSNGCYTDDMQNGSGPHPEFESWNSWYGQPANVGKVDTSELECFWISDESNLFSTIRTNANM